MVSVWTVNLTNFMHTKFSVLCWAVSMQLLRKQRKRKLEAVKFWRKRKCFDKISWKLTRKWPTLSEAASKKSQEWGSQSKLGSMTLQEELEAEAKMFYCFYILGKLVSISTFSVLRNWLKHLVYQNLPLDGSIQDFVMLGTFRTKFNGFFNTNIIISCILLSSDTILMNELLESISDHKKCRNGH